MIFSQQNFQYFSFSPNHGENFRTVGQDYLKQQHFELFSKSGGFYSLRSDPDPGSGSGAGSGSGSGFFSDPDPDTVKHGPDPPTLASGQLCNLKLRHRFATSVNGKFFHEIKDFRSFYR
jgi:hypothetical protein